MGGCEEVERWVSRDSRKGGGFPWFVTVWAERRSWGIGTPDDYDVIRASSVVWIKTARGYHSFTVVRELVLIFWHRQKHCRPGPPSSGGTHVDSARIGS
jgi:hypothetical protein